MSGSYDQSSYLQLSQHPSLLASDKQSQGRSWKEVASRSHVRSLLNDPYSPHLTTATGLPELPLLSGIVMWFFDLQLRHLTMEFPVPISLIKQGLPVKLNGHVFIRSQTQLDIIFPPTDLVSLLCDV